MHGSDTTLSQKLAMAFTAIGLLCLICMAIGRTNLFRHGPPPPPPDPDIQITSVVPGSGGDKIDVIRYWSKDKYPDAPPVEIGATLEFEDRVYELDHITNGFVSTWEGDCWETVYRLKQ